MTATAAPSALVTRTPTPWLVAGTAWLTLQVLVQQWGLLSHDTRFDVMLEPGDFLGRTWNLWDGMSDMGRVQNQAVGYLFPLGPFYWLTDLLGVPAWISQRLWIAALLGLAFWGMARLADSLAVGSSTTRLIAAGSYALSPFFIARVGNTSFFVQGAAMAPWVLLPLVGGSRSGSPRRAACLSGLAVVAIGGINAVTTAAALVIPALWLHTRQPGARRRALWRWWALAIVAATTWWGVALVFQGRYGLDFLPLTERASLTTSPTAPFEVVRGTADWLSRLVIDVAQLPSGATLVSSRPVIAATGLVAALGVFGIARRDVPERTFLVSTFLVGVALVGIGYGGVFGNPAAGLVRDFLDGPGGALRNVYKFQPIVMVPLALGVAHGGAAVVAAAQRLQPERSNVIRAGVSIALAAAVLAGAQPLFTNRLLNAKPFEEVPEWWEESADYLATVPGRTLVVPGLPNADFEWGYTAEEPLSWLAEQPWASRSLIPYGTYGAIRYLDVVERAIARSGDPGLASFLRRAGFSTVLVRNDGENRLYGAPSPSTVAGALVASGLTHDAGFGPAIDDEQAPGGEDVHEIDIYAVPLDGVDDTRVAGYPVSDAAVVSGDQSVPLVLSHWGESDRALVLAEGQDSGLADTSQWIVTDTNRRRPMVFGTTRNNVGATLAASEPVPPGLALFPGDDVVDQTVAVRGDVRRVSASSSGSFLAALPEFAPGRAMDGDPATAWSPAREVLPHHQFLRVDFREPSSPAWVEVDLLVPSGQPDAVTALRLVSENGETFTRVDSNEPTQRLRVPDGETSFVRVEFELLDGIPLRVGIAELRIDGITADSRLQTPAQLNDRFTAPDQPSPTYVFTRATADARTGASEEPESTMRRRFVMPRAGSMEVDAQVTAVPGAATLALVAGDDTFSVASTSTFGSLPLYAPRNLVDGDDDTIWVSGLRDDGVTIDSEPLVTVRWGEPRPIDRVVVEAAEGYEQPRAVRVEADGSVHVVPLSDDGVGSFPAVVTDSVTIGFVLPPPRVFTLDTPAIETMRIGLETLELPAVRDLQPGPVDLDEAVTVGCDDGPSVDVGGTERRFSVTATLDDVVNLRRVDATACDDEAVALDDGSHDLDTAAGTAPFEISGIRLRGSSVAPQGSSSPARAVSVVSWDDERRSVAVGAGDATVLAINENANEGWEATMDGEVLESVVLDGWRQGYVVPAGEEAVVTVRFVPTRPYRAGLLLGGVLVVVLIVGSFFSRSRPSDAGDPPPLHARAWPRMMAPAVLLATVAIGGIPAALLLLACWVLPRRQPLDLSVAIGAALVAAAVAAALPMPFDGTTLWNPFGKGVSALTVFALAALAASLLPPARNEPV